MPHPLRPISSEMPKYSDVTEQTVAAINEHLAVAGTHKMRLDLGLHHPPINLYVDYIERIPYSNGYTYAARCYSNPDTAGPYLRIELSHAHIVAMHSVLVGG
jgi:hypothetical protein